MQLSNAVFSETRALVHSGPPPAPGSVLRVTAVRDVAGKVFFDVQALDGTITTGELIAGCAPTTDESMRCTRRSGTYFVLELAHDTPPPHLRGQMSTKFSCYAHRLDTFTTTATTR